MRLVPASNLRHLFGKNAFQPAWTGLQRAARADMTQSVHQQRFDAPVQPLRSMYVGTAVPCPECRQYLPPAKVGTRRGIAFRTRRCGTGQCNVAGAYALASVVQTYFAVVGFSQPTAGTDLHADLIPRLVYGMAQPTVRRIPTTSLRIATARVLPVTGGTPLVDA